MEQLLGEVMWQVSLGGQSKTDPAMGNMENVPHGAESPTAPQSSWATTVLNATIRRCSGLCC